MKNIFKLLNKEIMIKADAIGILLMGCVAFNIIFAVMFFYFGSILGGVLMSLYGATALCILLRR